MTRTDTELVSDALDHLRILHQHLARADLADQTVADAVSLRLASAIESVAACSSAVRERVFGDDWGAAWSTRNRIAHGYAYIDLAVIRATVEHDLPQIESRLAEELARG